MNETRVTYWWKSQRFLSLYSTDFFTSTNQNDIEASFFAVQKDENLAEEEKIIEDFKNKWPKTIFEKTGQDIIFNPLKPPLPKQNFTYKS